MKVNKVLVVLTFAVIALVAEVKSEEFRLPNNSIPLRYDLFIKTDIDKKNFEYTGNVKIHVKILEPTDKITLHSVSLDIDKVDLLKVDKSVEKTNLRTKYNSDNHFLVITLPREFAVNEELILDIDYDNDMTTQTIGLYRAYYRNAENVKTWYATTHFEPYYARNTMPCYDEPAIRAVINVKIQHDKSYNAISNMPIISREELTNTDYVISSFEDTPPLQTYLLAFVISDFKYISDNHTRVEQRIYAKPQSIDEGNGDYALKVATEIVELFEKHFGIDFPMSKIDHVAVDPHFAGAMENYGAITYMDDYLILNPQQKYQSQLDIARVVGHELAHQYFGNLIAPQWWSYMWLNEGFASFYENFVLEHYHPEVFKMRRMRNLDRLFESDDDSRQFLNSYAGSFSEVARKLVHYTYVKGAAYIRTFHDAITPATFTKGLQYYLNEMKFKAASPKDLHRNLQKAFDEDFPGNGVDLCAAMRTWENQGGYPIVTVEKKENKFIFSQKSSTDKEEIYTIPISFLRKDLVKTNLVWMKEKTLEIESNGDDDFVIVNVGLSGYYQVEYGVEMWKLFLDFIQNHYLSIPALNRAQLLKDLTYKVKKNILPIKYAFAFFEAMKHEEYPYVWKTFIDLEDFFAVHLKSTEVTEKYQDLVKALIKPRMQELNKNINNEAEDYVNFRSDLVEMSCKSKQKDCLKFEYERNKKALQRYLKESEFSELNCRSVRLADEETYMQLLNKAKENSDYDNNLMCTTDKKLLKAFLTLIFENRPYLFIGKFESMIRKSYEGAEVALEFFANDFDNIMEKAEVTKYEIKYLDVDTNDPKHIEQLRALVKRAETYFGADSDDFNYVYEELDTNEKWTSTHLNEITTWLNTENH